MTNVAFATAKKDTRRKPLADKKIPGFILSEVEYLSIKCVGFYVISMG